VPQSSLNSKLLSDCSNPEGYKLPPQDPICSSNPDFEQCDNLQYHHRKNCIQKCNPNVPNESKLGQPLQLILWTHIRA
jgi:hypothetical protein